MKDVRNCAVCGQPVNRIEKGQQMLWVHSEPGAWLLHPGTLETTGPKEKELVA